MTPYSIVSAITMAAFALSAAAGPVANRPISFTALTGMAVPLDGTYSLTYDAAGNPNMTYHGQVEASVSALSTGSSLQSRGTAGAAYSGIGCDNIGLNNGDTNGANSALQRLCGGGRKGTIYQIQGDVVSFYCEWKSGPQCTGDSARHANEMITSDCGAYRGGSYSNGDKESRSYSYGYTNYRTHSFCNIVV